MNAWSAILAVCIALVAYVGSYALVRWRFTTAMVGDDATGVASFMHGVDRPLMWVTDLGRHRWLATLYRPLILVDHAALRHRTLLIHENGLGYDTAD